MPFTGLKGPCSYGMPGNRPCGDPQTRPFAEGPRCPVHTREALSAPTDQPTVDQDRTAES